MAFSAGPYGAALADGSEYDGNYAERVTEEQIMDFHAKRLHVSQALPVTSQVLGSGSLPLPVHLASQAASRLTLKPAGQSPSGPLSTGSVAGSLLWAHSKES